MVAAVFGLGVRHLLYKGERIMKFKIFTAAALIICLAYGPIVTAEELSKEKRADIEKLIEMTGALAIGKQMSDFFGQQYWQSIRAARPDVPPELFQALQSEINVVIDEKIVQLLDQIIPVYHKHFSHEEIAKLIAFYETPIGGKIITVMPALVQESMLVGQRWGQSLAPQIQRRVLERFKAEGVDLTV